MQVFLSVVVRLARFRAGFKIARAEPRRVDPYSVRGFAGGAEARRQHLAPGHQQVLPQGTAPEP